jgi:hypothetical protein
MMKEGATIDDNLNVAGSAAVVPLGSWTPGGALYQTLGFDFTLQGCESVGTISATVQLSQKDATGPFITAVSTEFATASKLSALVRIVYLRKEEAGAVSHSFVLTIDGTVRVFRQKFTLEDAIGSHACSLVFRAVQASRRVTNAIPLGCPLFVPVHTVNCV